MRLYYMTDVQTVEEHIIPEWRMKLSTFDNLNDPFELLCADQGDKLQRRVLKVLRDHWTPRLGIMCFSTSWKSPLMWAHYAKSHTGICLGIDVLEEDKLRKVIYEPDRLKGLFDGAKPLAGATEESLTKVLTTKFKQWEYEDEWRVFAKLDDRDPLTGLYYVDFAPTFTLREVIVGARCKRSVGSFAKLIKAAGKLHHPITIVKARPAFQAFEMVRQQRISPITVRPTKQD